MKELKHVSSFEMKFNEIYQSLWPQVYKFIYFKVQNEEEAKELTQDVFQKAYKQINKNAICNDKMKSYIFIAARNVVYDLWRKRGRRPKVIQLSELNESGLQLEDENSMIEANLMVEEVLKKLSHEDKTIIELRIIKGYSVNEVAEIMDIPEGTVKSKQFRALKKLKEKLSKGGYFDE